MSPTSLTVTVIAQESRGIMTRQLLVIVWVEGGDLLLFNIGRLIHPVIVLVDYCD